MILYKCLLPNTNVVTLAELLAGFGSKLGELTTAVFVADAGTGGIETRTVKLTVAEAPLTTSRLDVVVTTRSDLFSTVMLVDPAGPELLLVSGSNVLEVTDGALTRVVPSGTAAPKTAWIAIVTVSPSATVARLRIASPPEIVHVPSVEVQEVKVTPAGAGSLKATSSASSGPALLNCTV